MEETNLIECLVVKERQMFPKGRYYNDDGEYAIITFKVEEAIKGKPKRHPVYKTITVKGNMPSIKSGKVYHLLAQETYDENYKNYSYEVSYIGEKLSTMEDLDDIKTALEEVTSSKLANEIIKLDNIKNILESRDTEALKQIDGIGEVLSVKIMDKYHEKTKFGMYLIKLSKMGLTKNMLDALVKKYANYEAIYNKIRMNPYMLADSVKGIGFLKADALAEKFGIAQNSPERIRAYVKHLLNEKANEGKSFLLTKEVLSSLRSQTDETKFPISRDLISETFNKMRDKRELWWNENKTVLALPTVREIEKEIAEHLMRIKEGEFVFDDSLIEENIRAIEKRKGFEYTDEQREGIYSAMRNQVVVITGKAGCGKTAVLEPMTQILVEQQGKKILQVALSGKASQRMQEVTGYESKTIHRGLDFNPRLGGDGFVRNEEYPLDQDIVVLDEASMVDATLFRNLLRAIPTGTKLVIVGDSGQLPNIGFGQVFFDLIECDIIPVVRLNKIHRQAQKSAIITESIKVRENGHIIGYGEESTELLGELQDLQLDIALDRDKLVDKTLDHFKKRLEIEKDIMEVQVVVATKTRGDLSAFNLNNKIKEIVNPIGEDDLSYIESTVDNTHKYQISEGDKVIIVKNNYKVEVWNETSKAFTTGAIFNGNLGIVEKIGISYIIVNIVGIGKVKIDEKNYNSIELGYAITCHKCITGDALILTDEGLKTIKEIVENREGKVYNGEELETPSDFISVGKEEVFKVTTNRGFSITGTRDHNVEVIDESGWITTKAIEDIVEGDALLSSMNSNIYGNQCSFPKECYDTSSLDVRTVIHKEYPTELNEELSELLGMIVADGTVNRKRLKFSKRHLEVSLRFSSLIKKYFDYEVTPKLRKSGDYMCEISSTYISNFFDKIDGLQPNKKDVPSIIVKSSKENQCAFLRGLFEDGTVNIKKDKFDHIELAMGRNSKDMIKKVQLMLLNMGIISTFRKIENKNRVGYVLYIYKDYAKIFLQNIGFISSFKQERLKKCLDESTRNSARKSIPFIINIMRDVAKDNPQIQVMKGHLKYMLFSDGNVSESNVTSTMFNRFMKIYGHLDDERVKYLQRFYRDIYVDKVSKVEDVGVEDVFCLTMPKTHRFVQNGIRQSNCQGSQSKSVIIAIDSGAYMLLSCEWLYTAITRAISHCTLIGENKAIRRCCSVSNGSNKQTFLPSFLEQIKQEMNNSL